MSIRTCRKCGQQLIGECFFCRTERKDPIDDKYNIPPEIEKAREKELQELIASKQTDAGERGDEDAEEEEEQRDPLDSEWEEVVLDLAQKHHLGRRIRQIATMRDQAPDVFYTDASYRTHELFSFAEELMQTAREPLVKSISDMTWAMAIIREITKTQQAETFEETVEAVRALATQQAGQGEADHG